MAQENFLDPPMADIIEQWKFYLNKLGIQEGDDILDVGSNRGCTEFFLTRLYPYINSITGLDNNPDAVNDSLKMLEGDLYKQKISFVQGDAMALPYDDNSFDKVICLEVLEWVEDSKEAIGEMKRVLKPGGKALIGHTDFDTQIFTTKDLARERRINQIFCDSGPDGTIGRKLKGICKKVGFTKVEPIVYTLTNERFEENNYSYRIAYMMKEWLLTKDEDNLGDLEAWIEEMKDLSKKGEFYYSINRYLTICEK